MGVDIDNASKVVDLTVLQPKRCRSRRLPSAKRALTM